MAFGLLPEGLVIKRFSDIKAEQEATLRAKLGNEINLLPQELLGQIVGIMSEREALIWELVQVVYNSQYPPTAEGVSLDLCVALTGQTRLDASKSNVDIYCDGAVGTVIPQGSIVSVVNNPSSKFISTIAGTIGAGVDCVQLITFSNTPNGGAFTLVFEGETTASIAHSATAADVQAALNALIALQDVTVTGSFVAGFTVTFAGLDGSKPQSLLAYGANTLNLGGVNTTITIAQTVPGELPHVEIPFQSEFKGAYEAPAGSLTVIETAIAGWDNATNLLDADIGLEVETDAALRIRREQTLSNPGSTTLDAIYAKLVAVDGVKQVRVYTNREMIPDIAGRPPKSFQCIVRDGADADIAKVIWDNCPAGIEMWGAEHVVVVDSQGFNQDVYFDRPTDVEIWLEVDVTVNSLFPANGTDTIKQSILDYAPTAFGIGDDIITDWLYCPINCVPGIEEITIRIGIVNPPVGDANITILDNELGMFDSGRITVTEI